MKGVQMLRIPKSKFAMYANWSRDLYGGTIDYLLTYAWTSSIMWDDSGTALDRSQPFDRMDFKVSWRNADEDLEIMAFVNNVHNRIGVRNTDSDGENQGFRRSVTPTLPRSAGIGFTYKFGAY